MINDEPKLEMCQFMINDYFFMSKAFFVARLFKRRAFFSANDSWSPGCFFLNCEAHYQILIVKGNEKYFSMTKNTSPCKRQAKAFLVLFKHIDS